MKKILLMALLTAQLTSASPFKNGERIAFLGDSITHGGKFIAYLQMYQDVRYPGSGVRFLNCGRSGASLPDAIKLLDLDLFPMKPDHVFIMFGVNDQNWCTKEQYRVNLEKAIDLIQAKSIGVSLLTSTPYDEYSEIEGNEPQKGRNEKGLTEFAQVVKDVAAERKLRVIDIHGPLTALIKAYPSFHYAKDRVHADWEGHRAMASIILRGLGESQESIASFTESPRGVAKTPIMRNLAITVADYRRVLLIDNMLRLEGVNPDDRPVADEWIDSWLDKNKEQSYYLGIKAWADTWREGRDDKPRAMAKIGLLYTALASGKDSPLWARPEEHIAYESSESVREGAKCSYRESALRLYDYIFALPAVQNLLAAGEPDRKYILNSYPAKIDSALIRGMIRYAALRPERAADAMKVARAAADYLVRISEPAGTPLEYFPPTYEANPEQERTPACKKYQGQTMISYPADAGIAFLELAKATGDAKYRTAALHIAETFLRLQREDGTWFLKLNISDGSNVNTNTVHPMNVAELLEGAFAVTGDERFRNAADRAMSVIEKGPMIDYNWEGQFEDVEPKGRYSDLSMYAPCDTVLYMLKRYPGDAKRIDDAKRIMKFVEDVFVYWQRPQSADYDEWTLFPTVTEQFDWWVPIDASMAKVSNAWLALYDATNDESYLAKAKAMADALTRAQMDSGRIPTEFWKSRIDNPGLDWLNCMLESGKFLDAMASRN